jgi:hypothetical protein
MGDGDSAPERAPFTVPAQQYEAIKKSEFACSPGGEPVTWPRDRTHPGPDRRGVNRG